jgi:hypothetical protein
LNTGDLLYTNQNLTVNSIGSYDFAGATRDSVYGWDPYYDEDGYLIEAHTMVWDRETGILCRSDDMYIHYVNGTVVSKIFTFLNIVETSLWEPSASFFDSWWFAVVIAIAVFIGVLIVSVAFLLWRKRKFKRHKTGRR